MVCENLLPRNRARGSPATLIWCRAGNGAWVLGHHSPREIVFCQIASSKASSTPRANVSDVYPGCDGADDGDENGGGDDGGASVHPKDDVGTISGCHCFRQHPPSENLLQSFRGASC